ncbi:MAG TPA: MBL fold metallo-hydrolase [Chthoniobacterales bacterium]|jgi:glyoxylase-like metal-dependent hydrolase (beta-lactamase superfamily II)
MSKPYHSFSRRRFLASTGLFSAAAWLSPRQLFAAEADIVTTVLKHGATAKITVQPLRENVSALIGSGGNIAVLTGPDGKVMVDAGFSTSRGQIADALVKIGAEPLKHLINTHWHFDHTDGNSWMHAAGATILAHVNTREHLSHTTRVEAWHHTFLPSPAGALPTEIFERKQSLHLNGTEIALTYYGPSHTDSDISAYFVQEDVFHTGDTWWNGYYPFIDYSTGGNIYGMIKAAEINLASITHKTIVIPGHGPIGGKTEMTDYRNMLVTIRDRVAALKKQGKSLSEVIAAKPTKEYDSKWATHLTTGDVFTKYVYQGV